MRSQDSDEAGWSIEELVIRMNIAYRSSSRIAGRRRKKINCQVLQCAERLFEEYTLEYEKLRGET